MTRVAFFGHDAADAAIRRRIRAMKDDGLTVTGFMMRRRDDPVTEWDNVDLGMTRDGAFLQRIARVFTGARLAAKQRDQLAAVDVIYARNLDMLACAFLAKRYASLDTPVIYECLDVHRLLTRSDFVGKALRWIERRLLKRCSGLVVSSPGFLTNHFEKHYNGLYTAHLIENRLAAGAYYGPRPLAPSVTAQNKSPLRIGWVGILRCKRSLDLLCAVADALPDQVEIHLHGLPARTELEIFEPLIDARANMTYHGRYKAPEDLLSIYSGLDIVWAGDFMEAGYNSVWLLPNRIYEGGYYATPSVAPANTETAAWIIQNACGFTLPEPLETSLPAFFTSLTTDRSELAERAEALLNMPDEAFIQPHGTVSGIVDSVLAAHRRGA